MPQISRCRISNFYYNDGNRIIADELYDFTGSQNINKVLNTLINMDNGIGKTVVTQLMLQPVIPGATVSGRKIEDFFYNPGMHSYVVLEWVLDGSDYRLLTGISLSASDITNKENENTNNRIKYYTFITSYIDASKYDITSLDLSTKQNSKFVAADFDFVRNLAKNSGGKLQYYSSDQRKEWKDILFDYGIVQNEWINVVAKLNSNEGGMSDFFKNIKKSGDLIDKLFIPVIEGKNGNSSSDIHELEDMLISYARKYNDKERVIQEKIENETVKIGFEKAIELATNVWNTHESYIKTLSENYGYRAALKKYLEESNSEKNGYEEKIEAKRNYKKGISYEKASAEYYKSLEKSQKVNEELQSAEAKEKALKTKREKTKYDADILKCAKYYKRKCSSEAEIKVISDQINTLMENSEISEKISNIRTSLYKTIMSLKPGIEKERDIKTTELLRLEKENTVNCNKKESLQSKIEDIKKEILGKEALYKKQKEDTDELIENLGISLTRLLFGGFDTDELVKIEKEKQNEQNDINERIWGYNEKKSQISQRRDELPGQIADKNVISRDVTNEIESIKKEIEEYKLAEERIQRYYDQYGYEFDKRSSGAIEQYLCGEVHELERKNKEADKSIHQIDGQLRAIENGSLHIFQDAIDYLEDAGVNYQTCESYILRQIKKNNISVEDVELVLSKYPFLAFSIIMEETERKKLDAEKGEWLSSAVPLITNEEFARYLKGDTVPNGKFIALYQQEYFVNSESFIIRLQNMRDDLSDKVELNNSDIKKLGDIEREIIGFNEAYPIDWLSNASEKLKNKQENKKNVEREIEVLNEEKNRCEEVLSEIDEKIEEGKNSIRSCEEWLKKCEMLYAYIADEKEYSNKLSELHSEKTRLDNESNTLEENIKTVQRKVEELQDGISVSDTELSGMNDALEEIGDMNQEGDFKHDNAVTEPWENLYDQYKNYVVNQDKDAGVLREKLELAKDRKKEAENELSLFSDFSESDYKEVIYNDDKIKKLNKELDEIHKSMEDMSEDIKSLNRKVGIADNACNECLKRILDFSEDGKPLDKAQIGSDFDDRIKAVDFEIKSIDGEFKRIDKLIRTLEKLSNRVDQNMEELDQVEQIVNVTLDKDDLTSQWDELHKNERQRYKEFKETGEKLNSLFDELIKKYENSEFDYIVKSIKQIKQLFNSEIEGDKTYTVIEQLNGFIHNTELRISKIRAELDDFEKSKQDLVRQCTYQGRRMYEGLNKMQKSSSVLIIKGMPKKQILKLDIPKDIDENISKSNIEHEIDNELPALVKNIREGEVDDIKIEKVASRIVSSSNLLRKYIGRDVIKVEAYKIDKTPENSGYRTWEKTQTQNSGAEKFVIYFTIILSLITYNRSENYEIADKDMRSVLILDNPFGPITSPHVLKPMFLITEQFNVQLICFSNITKCDITERFENRIDIRLKKVPMSNKEFMTHDGNDQIEHGFYKSEQMTLFD